MKSIRLTILLLIIGIMPISAGIRFGATLSGVMPQAYSLSELTQIKPQNLTFSGFRVGPMIDIGLPLPFLSVQGALVYSQQTMDFVDIVKASQYMLELPIDLKFKIGIPKIVSVYANAGIGMAYVFNNSISETSVNTFTSMSMDKVQWKARLGGGVEIIDKIQVSAVWEWGLNKSQVELLGSSIPSVGFNSNQLILSVGYFF